jgi:hypothetical protein
VANLGVLRQYDSNEFMSLVTEAGLCLYVRRRLDKQPILLQTASKEQPLLEITIKTESSLTGLTARFRRKSAVFDVDMAGLRFTRGADPNSCIAKGFETTIWEEFLSVCSKFSGGKSQEAIFQMAELFIRHGAELDVKVHTNTHQRIFTKRKTPLVRTKSSREASSTY